MRRLLAVWVLGLWCGLVAADPFPALYDVTSVEAGDVLNIRSEPDATSAIIGGLAPDSVGVEVTRLSADRRWARVQTRERMGWASVRFLALVPRQGEGFSQGLSCVGTEPFWLFKYRPFGRSEFTSLGGLSGSYDIGPPIRAVGRPNVYGLRGSSDLGDVSAILRRGECSDGMSEVEFGLSFDLILPDGEGDVVYTGCCNLGVN
ncbi:MAG: peptide-binding protein [Pseudomonadota bacterium]